MAKTGLKVHQSTGKNICNSITNGKLPLTCRAPRIGKQKNQPKIDKGHEKAFHRKGYTNASTIRKDV